MVLISHKIIHATYTEKVFKCSSFLSQFELNCPKMLIGLKQQQLRLLLLDCYISFLVSSFFEKKFECIELNCNKMLSGQLKHQCFYE